MISLEKYKNWEGAAERLAKTAASLMREGSGFGDAEFIPNERLVRDYVARGILDKPERRGKEAIFGFEQLVQFLACRAMLADGWPLSKIAEDFRHASFDDTLALIPGEQHNNEALNLIESFKKERTFKSERIMESHSPRSISRSANMEMASEDAVARSPDFRERQRRNFEYRSDIGAALLKMGSDFSNAVKIDFTALQLATWLKLFIDRDRAERITVDEAEAIGRAVTAGLLNQDSLTKDDVSALAKGNVDQLQRIREEHAVMRQQVDELKKLAEEEQLRLNDRRLQEEVMIRNIEERALSEDKEQERRLSDYRRQAEGLEVMIEKMKVETKMIDEELEQKRRELKS